MANNPTPPLGKFLGQVSSVSGAPVLPILVEEVERKARVGGTVAINLVKYEYNTLLASLCAFWAAEAGFGSVLVRSSPDDGLAYLYRKAVRDSLRGLFAHTDGRWRDGEPMSYVSLCRKPMLTFSRLSSYRSAMEALPSNGLVIIDL